MNRPEIEQIIASIREHLTELESQLEIAEPPSSGSRPITTDCDDCARLPGEPHHPACYRRHGTDPEGQTYIVHHQSVAIEGQPATPFVVDLALPDSDSWHSYLASGYACCPAGSRGAPRPCPWHPGVDTTKFKITRLNDIAVPA